MNTKKNITIFQGKYKKYRLAALIVAAAAVAANAVLCATANTANSARHETAVLCTGAVSVCVCIFILMNLATRQDRKQPWWIMKHGGRKGNFFSRLPAYLAGIVCALFFWEWVFGLSVSMPAENKVVIYAEVPGCSETELALELEKAMPEGIRQVTVHTFDYAMFDADALLSADIYIIREENYDEYSGSFGPIPSDFAEEHSAEYFYKDGAAKGIYVRTDGFAAAAEYIEYEDTDYILFFNAESLHTAELSGSADNAAVTAAFTILNLD